MRRKRNRRVLLTTAILAAVIATGAFAYTNTITGVTPPNVGSGSGAINGYAATNISYNLNAANPANVDSVQFNLASATAATTVQVQAVNAGTWYTCNAPSGGAPMLVVCPTAGVTAAAANNLTIVAKGP
jgi:FlaG/FlaF family flagellin (archaellin)